MVIVWLWLDDIQQVGDVIDLVGHIAHLQISHILVRSHEESSSGVELTWWHISLTGASPGVSWESSGVRHLTWVRSIPSDGPILATISIVGERTLSIGPNCGGVNSVVEIDGNWTITSGIGSRVVWSSDIVLGGVHVVLSRDRPGSFEIVSISDSWTTISSWSINVEIIVINHWRIQGVVNGVIVVANYHHVRVLVVELVGAVTGETIVSGSDKPPLGSVLSGVAWDTSSKRIIFQSTVPSASLDFPPRIFSHVTLGHRIKLN
jgi:hypothetical protein